MKYLDELTETLLACELDKSRHDDLRRILEAHDGLLHLCFAEQRGELIHRDHLAETIAASMREAVMALVVWCCDERRVPPGLRDEIEAVFTDMLSTAIRRCSSANPGPR